MFNPLTAEDEPSHLREPDRIGQILLKSADLIRRHGWRQRDYGDCTNGMCTMGAVARAAEYKSDDIGAAQARVFKLPIASGYNAITVWNDAPERTAADVIAALEDAALLL